MKKLQAAYIFDGHKLHTNAILVTEDDGTIIELINTENRDESVTWYDGLIMPGFINTHCHLELSHLQNKVPTGTGLLPFLSSVVQFRDVEQNTIDSAIDKQDSYMWKQGIQAVGDICNKLDTKRTKDKSPIRYYSFVEMFDLLVPAFTDNSFTQYKDVFDGYTHDNNNTFSAVPHAPYTVTKDLFARINTLNSSDRTVSIHNQETPHENEYFHKATGGFSDFFNGLGLPPNDFHATKKDSIYYAMDNMDDQAKVLFVHNTMTSRKNIQDAIAWNKNTYWATCPNANLYIENSLPNYKIFIEENAKMTVGTDSLTSNWQLSILEELKTLQRYNSYISIESLLQWSTINGAEALSFDDQLGSFQQGKKPGIIQLKEFQGKDLQHCSVNRIA